jgi:hypothetical protein
LIAAYTVFVKKNNLPEIKKIPGMSLITFYKQFLIKSRHKIRLQTGCNTNNEILNDSIHFLHVFSFHG